MAKARRVVGDQNSAELDALKRSYNSLLIMLERVCEEVVATTLTPAEGFEAILNALNSGLDSSGVPAAHVGTGRLVVGVASTPQIPPRSAESASDLIEMIPSDKY